MIGASGYTAGSTKIYGLQAGAGIGRAAYDSRRMGLGKFPSGRPCGLSYGTKCQIECSICRDNYFIINGLSATGRFDYFKVFSGPGSPIYYRYIFGVNIYPIPHIDLMPQVRFNSSTPRGQLKPHRGARTVAYLFLNDETSSSSGPKSEIVEPSGR